MASKKTARVAVSIRGVTKSFSIPIEGSNGIKQKLINAIKKKSGYRKFTPLNDISFDIKEGEFFGIVGKNGSGKSTLLKTIAGIYTPNKGSIKVNGSLVPFIELGVGFNPELTGRENVYLNGALLGFSRSEMQAMYEDIVDFAELHSFMEERLKNYSSGMQVRLAFSIAIRARADILLLDEVLAVGDEAFQRKCYSYFAQLKKDKRTVILVTHDMASVQRFCTSAMLLDKGKIVSIGNITKVTQKYQELNQLTSTNTTTVAQLVRNQSKFGTLDTKIRNEKNKQTSIFTSKDKHIYFETLLSVKQDMPESFIGFTIWREDGSLVYWYTTEPEFGKKPQSFKANTTIALNIKMQNIFGNGKYFVSSNVKNISRSIEYITKQGQNEFSVSGYTQYGWTLKPDVQIKVGEK